MCSQRRATASRDVSARARSLTQSTRPTPGSLRMSFASASRIESGLRPTFVTASRLIVTMPFEEPDAKCCRRPWRGSARSRRSPVERHRSARAVVCSRSARSSGYGATPWSAVSANTMRDESRILYNESINMPRYLSRRTI